MLDGEFLDQRQPVRQGFLRADAVCGLGVRLKMPSPSTAGPSRIASVGSGAWVFKVATRFAPGVFRGREDNGLRIIHQFDQFQPAAVRCEGVMRVLVGHDQQMFRHVGLPERAAWTGRGAAAGFREPRRHLSR